MEYSKKITGFGAVQPMAGCTTCYGSCYTGCYGGCEKTCSGDCAGSCKFSSRRK
ncbi:hypothetical protein [Gorillibacterium sp. CAU 1737]|uniref:hypothetical protein n=1 Tax=Gorillibacterium sp. CAU 1737 TaxID=3140362 RepID=UPI003260F73C